MSATSRRSAALLLAILIAAAAASLRSQAAAAATTARHAAGGQAAAHARRDGDLRQRQAAVRAGGHRSWRTASSRRSRSATSDSPPIADAVIDATGKYVMPGHRQHAHALARGAAAGHAAADPVRAQPVPRRRRDHGARGRRRLRQVEAMAGREQRAHDHRAAHPASTRPSARAAPARRPRSARGSREHQGERRRRPEDHRHRSRSARGDHGRGAQARACGRRRTSASRRRRRRTTSSSASTRSSTSTASPTRRIDGIQRFPADMNYSNESPPVRPRRRAVRAGRSREARTSHRPDGREERRVEPDVLDLRGEPRSRARAEPALVQRLPAPVAWRSSCSRRSTTTARTSSAGRPRRKRAGSSTTASGWTRSASSAERRPDHDRRRRRATSTRSTASASSRELELHEEAGFQPLEVIEHATVERRAAARAGRSPRQGPRGLHRRSARRQRQPAREPAVLNPDGRRRERRTATNSRAAAASSGRSRTASRITCRR